MYFGHKYVETGRNCLHELSTILKYHMPLISIFNVKLGLAYNKLKVMSSKDIS